MAKTQYKVHYFCHRCRNDPVTRFKDNPDAPDRCNECGSSYTVFKAIDDKRVK